MNEQARTHGTAAPADNASAMPLEAFLCATLASVAAWAAVWACAWALWRALGV